MFVEIHNAIVAALKTAPYQRFVVDAKTLLIDEDKSGEAVAPNGVNVRQTYSAFKQAEMRREFTLEISQQLWQAIVEVPGLIDFSAAEDFLSSPIHVEPAGHRPLLVVLQSGHYNTPPAQDAASGSTATFTFQIFAPTLRK